MAIEQRPFGRTGHLSSSVIFGGAALGRVDQATADRVLELLLEFGVNHIDTAPSYGDSELRIGPWMDRHRDDFFLATKTRERDYAGARAEIHRSLERLRTDRVDLLQLHALYHPDEWEHALAPGGALDAAREAREQGLIRFIGVTGHGWTVAAMHRRSLERFDFDSILLPWNWQCAHHETYAADFEATVALCAQRRVAVQTIKALARGPWAAGARAPAHDLVPATRERGRHPPGGRLGAGATRHLPQLGGRCEPAAGGAARRRRARCRGQRGPALGGRHGELRRARRPRLDLRALSAGGPKEDAR